MKRRVPTVALGVLLAARVHAGVGTAGAQSLREPLAARPAALGEAFAAVGGTAEAIGYNPAGLAGLPAPEGGALYRAGFAGDTFVSLLGGGTLMGFGVGASLGYATDGTVEALDPTGRTAPVNAQQDVSGAVGGGYRFTALPVAAGLAVRVFHSRLLEDVAATAIGADAGVQASLPGGLDVGASVQHLGGGLRYGADALPADDDALPRVWRFGAAWGLELPQAGPSLAGFTSVAAPPAADVPAPHHVRVFAGGVFRAAEDVPEWGGGLELDYAGRLALRAGFRRLARGVAEPHAVWSLGLGARLGRVRFDYAAELLDAGIVHRAGLTLAGRPPEAG